MADDNNDTIALVLANFQTTANQDRADSLSLKIRQDRHRSKGQCRHFAINRYDGKIAEHDVTDHLIPNFGDHL